MSHQDNLSDVYATRMTLILAAQKRQREDEFASRYMPLWCDWAAYQVSRGRLPAADRGDLVQETWIRISKGLPSLEPRPGRFRRWMKKIMIRTAIDFSRKRREISGMNFPNTAWEPSDDDSFWRGFWLREKLSSLGIPQLRAKLAQHGRTFTPLQWKLLYRVYWKRDKLVDIAKDHGWLKKGTEKGNAASVTERIRPILDAARELLKDHLAE